MRTKYSKTLISQDFKDNTVNYKYTTSIDIAPICKDDLVLLPKALSRELGGIGPFVLVHKISTYVHLVDVYSMRTYEMDQVAYWKHGFTAMSSRDRLKEFIVVGIENVQNDLNISKAAEKQRFK